MLGRQLLQQLAGVLAEFRGVALHLDAGALPQHRHARRSGDGVACEGVEVEVGAAELIEEFGRGDDASDGMPVAERLAQRHQVRTNAVQFVAPEMQPDPTEAGLHLVGDDQTAGVPHQFHQTLDVPGGWPQQPLGGKQRIEQQRGHTVPCRLQRRDRGGRRGQRFSQHDVFGPRIAVQIRDAQRPNM